MAQRPGLGLQVGQRLLLGAGLRPGMEMLALPLADLWNLLEERAAENPLLIVERPDPAVTGSDMAAQAVAGSETLPQSVKRQIGMMALAPDLRRLALYLADDLDERGYLTGSDAELADETGQDAGLVAEARAALQACEPSGVGARDLAECLQLQLVDGGVPAATARAACAHLAAFARSDHAGVAAATGMTVATVEDLARRLRACTPEPAASFAAPQDEALGAELAIVAGPDGRPVAMPLEDPTGAVRLDEDLTEAALMRGTGAARAFVSAHRIAAQQLMTALAFRQRTLLAVGMAVAEAQAAYFMGHTRAQRPLRRADIAETLGLHPSTVGRAIRGRGLVFRGQIRPFAWYFPSGRVGWRAQAGEPAVGTGLGDTLSPIEIQARISALIAEETADSVLSDTALTARLNDDGVDIARRTVANYRQCLRIPSSPDRRRQLKRAHGQGKTRQIPRL